MWLQQPLRSHRYLKWSEITGTQREAHYSGTSGVSGLRQTEKQLISTENGEQIVHTLAVIVFSRLWRREIDRCRIALLCFIQAVCQNQSQIVCAFVWISDEVWILLSVFVKLFPYSAVKVYGAHEMNNPILQIFILTIQHY